MAPAGGFWAAAGAWVVFGCAQGESGEVVVLLGAKEEEKELWWGRNAGGGRSVDGGELRRACARLSLAFKAAREREGSAGCRWRAALKAGRGQRRGQVRGRACLSQRRRRGAPLMASRGAARGGRGVLQR